ncbi:MAG: M15 family metallopeptidase, partial [Gaiellaceae bacterium]
TGSFRCRQAVPSPCVGGSGSGSWSNHAYGHAIDLNPVENPYVGCGRTRDRASARYIERTRLRKGMVTPAVVRAFRSIGWGWGGRVVRSDEGLHALLHHRALAAMA